MDEPRPETPAQKLIERCVTDLMEYYDSVQIFVTERHDDKESVFGRTTSMIEAGAGNYYARYGQVASWLNKQSEHDRIEARSQRGVDPEV